MVLEIIKFNRLKTAPSSIKYRFISSIILSITLLSICWAIRRSSGNKFVFLSNFGRVGCAKFDNILDACSSVLICLAITSISWCSFAFEDIHRIMFHPVSYYALSWDGISSHEQFFCLVYAASKWKRFFVCFTACFTSIAFNFFKIIPYGIALICFFKHLVVVLTIVLWILTKILYNILISYASLYY